MFSKNNLLLLRFPFSFLLLPVFLFALVFSKQPDIERTILIFLILHFFIYPASNAYNSYMDRDTESIGTLKNPPEPGARLFQLSILFDFIGLSLSFYLGVKVFMMLLIYVIA